MDSSILDQVYAFLSVKAPSILLAIVTLIIGFIIIGYISRIINNIFKARQVEHSLSSFLSSLMNVGLKVMLLLSVAGMLGIQTTSFIAIFTALAFAIGTALSGSLGNFASGVLILLFKPYKVGDLVTLNDKTGTVSGIHIFNTELITVDNKKIILPNSMVTSNPITNISGQGVIRVDMQFKVSSDEDIDKVRSVIKAVADKNDIILKEPGIDVLVNSLTDTGIKFDIRPWCKSEHFWDVYYYMQEGIKKAFVREAIKGPQYFDSFSSGH